MPFTAWTHTESNRHRDRKKHLLWFHEVWWFQYSMQPPEAVNSLYQSLPRYYLKNLGMK